MLFGNMICVSYIVSVDVFYLKSIRLFYFVIRIQNKSSSYPLPPPLISIQGLLPNTI